MLKIAICDDENKICELYSIKLRAIMLQEHRSAEISCYSDSLQFFEIMRLAEFDIVFLDIDMPDITGLAIAEEMMGLVKKPLLVFVTNQDALVYQSFQYHPYGFIRKSYFDEEIEEVLIHAMNDVLKEDLRFVFRFESETISLSVSEILYFEASGNYLILHTSNNRYRFRETMSKVEHELSAKGFIRIHKGFLLNQEAVFRIGKDDVTLSEGSVLPIGRINKDVVKQKLKRYLMR